MDVEALEVDIEEEIEEGSGRDVEEDITTTPPPPPPPYHPNAIAATAPFPINSYTPPTMQPSPISWAGPQYPLPAGFTQPASHAMQHQNSTAGLFNHPAGHIHHSSSSMPFSSTPDSTPTSSLPSHDSQDFINSPNTFNGMTMDYTTFNSG
ncbi:hypothetical protein K438DRAFT_1967168 [Mycena galopus ATCC 62051]|nr:hypothetical protein K438DRAFT_1967168 [Mycena galopus ATCC 62051]